MHFTSRAWVFGVVAILTACTAGSVTGKVSVEDVERQRFAAMVAVDVDKLDSLLGEELRYTHSNGRVETKAQFLQAIRSGAVRYLAIDPKDVAVRHYGRVALLAGSAHLRVRDGQREMEADIRFTDAYLYRNGRWQLIAWQSTRVQ